MSRRAGSTLYTVFEVQAWISLAVGGLLSFNLLFPTDQPSIARMLGCAALSSHGIFSHTSFIGVFCYHVSAGGARMLPGDMESFSARRMPRAHADHVTLREIRAGCGPYGCSRCRRCARATATLRRRML